MVWQFLVFVSFIQGIIFFGHFLLYKTLIKFLPLLVDYSTPLKYGLLVLSLSFLLVNFVTFRWYLPFVSPIYYAAAAWLGTLFWLFFACLLIWLLFGIKLTVFSALPMQWVSGLLLLAAVVISAYGIFHSYQTQVVTYRVRLESLPDFWQGKKIVLVADTHLGNVRKNGFSEKIAKLIEAQGPEAVLISGDFYDGPPADYLELAKPFGRIKTPQGVFFANGNHEEFSDNSVYVNALTAAGVKVLKNAFVEIEGLQVVGVDYSPTNTDQGLRAVLDQIAYDRQKPTVLIKHVPNALNAAEAGGIDLQVSGHTHRAQVWPLSYLVKKIFNGYHYGLKPKGQMQVITTSGAGTWGPPQRIGTNGEIVVIVLDKK